MTLEDLKTLCRAAEDSWLGTTFESSLAATQARELGRGALGLAQEGSMERAIRTARSAVVLERKHLGENGPWALFLEALEKAS